MSLIDTNPCSHGHNRLGKVQSVSKVWTNNQCRRYIGSSCQYDEWQLTLNIQKSVVNSVATWVSWNQVMHSVTVNHQYVSHGPEYILWISKSLLWDAPVLYAVAKCFLQECALPVKIPKTNEPQLFSSLWTSCANVQLQPSHLPQLERSGTL